MTACVHVMPFGAEVRPDGVRFRLWAPDAGTVHLCLEGPDVHAEMPLTAAADGWRERVVADVGPGARYRYRIGDDLRVPDPASRYQPDDVHAASQLIDAAAYAWQAGAWRGRPWHEAVIYEVHVGTFTAAGTFVAAMERLPYLVDLGVSAIELMPVADFPGRRGWGYDGVLPFAPDSAYGHPDELKALVDRAHQLGLMAFLDVVFNHFGPDGNYLHSYAQRFFDADRHTPWGAPLIDFKQPVVGDFFIHNALFWLEEYCFDGLRLDAVHAIDADNRGAFLTALSDRVHARFGGQRHVHLVLENDANEARYLGAAGTRRLFAAQWNDDIHHAVHVLTSGERDGYYIDYADDPIGHLTRCLAEGFAYQGETSPFRGGARRGEPSGNLPPFAFVNFLQNHDQIGNRAFGERLATLTPPERLRAATAVVLLAPSIPLLFMGDEWAAATPFLFFCDLGDHLADAVREGRREEFAAFERFRDPQVRARIPDPTDAATFKASRLDWDEAERAGHRDMLAFHRDLLSLRAQLITPRLAGMSGGGRVVGRAGAAFTVGWTLGEGSTLTVVANLSDTPSAAPASEVSGEIVFSTRGPAPHPEPETLPPWSVTWLLDAARPSAS